MPFKDGEAPICPVCKLPTRLTHGGEIYPNRPELASRSFYRCDGCGSYVGCHKGTARALGTPADYSLRRARIRLHREMLDPLWEKADVCGLYRPENESARWIIRRTARKRVYEFLAQRMGLTREQCHVSMFDIEQCRAAWIALRGVSYPEIRAWAHARPKPPPRERTADTSLVPHDEGTAA